MTQSKRDVAIQTRVTKEEKEQIELLAVQYDLSLADYIRSTALAGPAPKLDPKSVEAQEERAEEMQDIAPDAEQTWTSKVVDPPEKPKEFSRDERHHWLVARIAELHRDKERRWPGVKARVQADAEWGHYKNTGEQPPPIEPRDEFKTTK